MARDGRRRGLKRREAIALAGLLAGMASAALLTAAAPERADAAGAIEVVG